MDQEVFDNECRKLARDSVFIKKAVDALVEKHGQDLDEFVLKVRDLLQLVKQAKMEEYDDESLQMQIIKLPTLLYLAGNGLEDIGAESELAVYNKKETYNKIIQGLDTSSYTITDKKAAAERGSETEEMLKNIYDRAYKKLKGKLDHAIKLLESLKKVADFRIAKINKGKGGE